MPKVEMDVRGQRCPVPTLKMTQKILAKEVAPGDVLEVLADCPKFEEDVRAWCANWKKALVLLNKEGAFVRCQVRI